MINLYLSNIEVTELINALDNYIDFYNPLKSVSPEYFNERVKTLSALRYKINNAKHDFKSN